jgi:hypothetical protein
MVEMHGFRSDPSDTDVPVAAGFGEGGDGFRIVGG